MTLPFSPSALGRVSILAVDNVLGATVMQAKDFFHMASVRYGKQIGLGLTPAFETRLVSPGGHPVSSFSDVLLPVSGGLDDSDIIILPTHWQDYDSLSRQYPQVLPWLRRQHARGAAICAQANGVFWLAASGLLDGKEATTYWRFFDEFKTRFPLVLLNPDKHLTDADNLFCAGGPVSACDVYIHLIERFCGAAIAQTVARDILYEVQRSYSPGRMGFGGQKLHRDVLILQVQQWLEDNFADKFRFEDVARQHGMSIRNFMRRFHSATGDKPLHYLQRLRIETAKGLLSSTRKSIKTISYEVGYDDASFFARLFRQHTELSPNGYRLQFIGARAAV